MTGRQLSDQVVQAMLDKYVSVELVIDNILNGNILSLDAPPGREALLGCLGRVTESITAPYEGVSELVAMRIDLEQSNLPALLSASLDCLSSAKDQRGISASRVAATTISELLVRAIRKGEAEALMVGNAKLAMSACTAEIARVASKSQQPAPDLRHALIEHFLLLKLLLKLPYTRIHFDLAVLEELVTSFGPRLEILLTLFTQPTMRLMSTVRVPNPDARPEPHKQLTRSHTLPLIHRDVFSLLVERVSATHIQTVQGFEDLKSLVLRIMAESTAGPNMDIFWQMALDSDHPLASRSSDFLIDHACTSGVPLPTIYDKLCSELSHRSKTQLVSILTGIVGNLQEQTQKSEHGKASRGDPLEITVKTKLWQVTNDPDPEVQWKEGWKPYPTLRVPTHTNATVQSFTDYVLTSLGLGPSESFSSTMQFPDGNSGIKPLKPGMTLDQAGFSTSSAAIHVEVFPRTIKQEGDPATDMIVALSQEVKLYESIFSVLAGVCSDAAWSQDTEACQLVEAGWALLQIMPSAECYLCIDSVEDWSHVLDYSRDGWKTIYTMQRIANKLCPTDASDTTTWRRSFLHSGGFGVICQMLNTLSMDGDQLLPKLGILPCLRVLAHCVDAASDSGVLSRRLSSASSEMVLDTITADHEKLIQSLIGFVQQDASSAVQATAITALLSVTVHSEQDGGSQEVLLNRVLQGAVWQTVLVSEHRAVRQATMQLLNHHSAAGGVVQLAMGAVRAAVRNGAVHLCSEALNVLHEALTATRVSAEELGELLSWAVGVANEEQTPLDSAWFELLQALVIQSPASPRQSHVETSIDLTRCTGSTEFLQQALSPTSSAVSPEQVLDLTWSQLYECGFLLSAPDSAAATSTLMACSAQSPSLARKLLQKLQALHEAAIASIGEPSWEMADPSATGGGAKPRGLVNQANTCYQNSVLQQLYMNPALCNGLLELQLPSESHPDIAKMLSQLQTTLRALQSRGDRAYDPKAFVQACVGVFSFSVWAQQDASDFLKQIMSRVELAVGESNSPFHALCCMKTQWECTARDKHMAPVCKLEEMPAGSPLDGSPSLLGLQDNKTGEVLPDLDTVFSNAVMHDHASMEWELSEKAMLVTEKRQVITSAPTVLLLQLARVGFGPKVRDKVRFGHTLDLTQYLSSAQRKRGERAVYQLSGVVVHEGESATYGHYFSYARDRQTGLWHQLNDMAVCTEDLNDVTNLERRCWGGKMTTRVNDPFSGRVLWQENSCGTGYMLFYDRVGLRSSATACASASELQLVTQAWHLRLVSSLMTSLQDEKDSPTRRAVFELAALLFFRLLLHVDVNEGRIKGATQVWSEQLGLLLSNGDLGETKWKDEILGAILDCPRMWGKECVYRLLLSHASSGREPAEAVLSLPESLFETRPELKIPPSVSAALKLLAGRTEGQQAAAALAESIGPGKHPNVIAPMHVLQALSKHPQWQLLIETVLIGLLPKETPGNSLSLHGASYLASVRSKDHPDRVALLLELASAFPDIVQPWLKDRSSAGKLDWIQVVTTESAERLIALVAGGEAPILHRIYEDMKRLGGSLYSRKWCELAIKQGGCTTAAAALAWIREHQAELCASATPQGASAEDPASEPELERAFSLDTAQRVRQQMLDEKLFDLSKSGDANLEEIESLIKEGANLESKHKQGNSQRTSLHMAVRNNQPKTVRLLLSSGAAPSPSADTSDGSSYGWTPMHNAVNYHGTSGDGAQGMRRGGDDMTEIVYLLIEARADLSVKISGTTTRGYWMGFTPLDAANSHNKFDLADIIKIYM